MQKTKATKIKLPESFRYLMWSYDFDKVNPVSAKEVLVVNTINYGNWEHWQWVTHFFGKEQIRKIIENLAVSEFRPSALSLAKLVFGVKKIKYAFRSDKIRAAKNL